MYINTQNYNRKRHQLKCKERMLKKIKKCTLKTPTSLSNENNDFKSTFEEDYKKFINGNLQIERKLTSLCSNDFPISNISSEIPVSIENYLQSISQEKIIEKDITLSITKSNKNIFEVDSIIKISKDKSYPRKEFLIQKKNYNLGIGKSDILTQETNSDSFCNLQSMFKNLLKKDNSDNPKLFDIRKIDNNFTERDVKHFNSLTNKNKIGSKKSKNNEQIFQSF